MSKVINIEEASQLVQDGMMLGLGGNVLHRSPMAFVRELVRQKRKNLRVVKTAGGHDVDILAAYNCLKSVDAGFIGYETGFGLAKFYRKAVEDGIIQANEHACYTVMSALRAAMANVGFMPIKGLMAGDLITQNDYFKIIEDPFTHENITVVKAITPDVAILHVQEADEDGNGFIFGPKYDDILLSNASKKIILTTEKLIPKSRSTMNFKQVDIPGFLVSAVVVAPRGAMPGSCDVLYDVDTKSLKDFLSITDLKGLNLYIQKYDHQDHQFR